MSFHLRHNHCMGIINKNALVSGRYSWLESHHWLLHQVNQVSRHEIFGSSPRIAHSLAPPFRMSSDAWEEFLSVWWIGSWGTDNMISALPPHMKAHLIRHGKPHHDCHHLCCALVSNLVNVCIKMGSCLTFVIRNDRPRSQNFLSAPGITFQRRFFRSIKLSCSR